MAANDSTKTLSMEDAAIVLSNLAAMAQSIRESGMDMQTFSDDIVAHKRDLEENVRHATRRGGLEEDEALLVLLETPQECTEHIISEVGECEDEDDRDGSAYAVPPLKDAHDHLHDDANTIMMAQDVEHAPPSGVCRRGRAPATHTKITKKVAYFKKLFETMEKDSIVTITRSDDAAGNSIFGWSSMTPNVDKLELFEKTMDCALSTYYHRAETRNMNFYLFMRKHKIGAPKDNQTPRKAPPATNAESKERMNATMFSEIRKWKYYSHRS